MYNHPRMQKYCNKHEISYGVTLKNELCSNNACKIDNTKNYDVCFNDYKSCNLYDIIF